MAILKIKDKDGNIIEVPAIVGPKGDSGVYIGNTEPEDLNTNVWINPTGVSISELLSQLYFKPGDTATVRFWTAGTITNNATSIHFSIPFDRPLIGVSNIVLSNVKAQIRQNDNYLLGSKETGAWDEPDSAHCALVNTQGQPNYPVVCTIGFNATPANAINNDAVGIAFEAMLTFE